MSIAKWTFLITTIVLVFEYFYFVRSHWELSQWEYESKLDESKLKNPPKTTIMDVVLLIQLILPFFLWPWFADSWLTLYFLFLIVGNYAIWMFGHSRIEDLAMQKYGFVPDCITKSGDRIGLRSSKEIRERDKRSSKRG